MTVFAFYLYGADHQLFFLDKNVFDIQGVHEILCFFRKFKNIFQTLAALGFPALCTRTT